MHLITYAVDGYTATITFNRPERLNAVNLELYEELRVALDSAEADRSIRVVVLTGGGRAFCAGADLKEHSSTGRTLDDKKRYAEAEQEVCGRLQMLRKPVIAGVNGYAIGAGAEIALSCDFVVMKESAEISFPETGLGTYIGGGLTYTLPLLVGIARARELVMLGRRLTGAEAKDLGLIYSVVSDHDFHGAITAIAAQLAEKAPLPISLAKRHINTFFQRTRKESLDQEAAALVQCMETADWREGINAFQEKRKPAFQGR
jgi:enoyl-CoA hydratase